MSTRIVWRVLFWSGIFTVLIGVGVANSYVNNAFRDSLYLTGGLLLIVLGAAFMVAGYLRSKGKICV
jgi:putative Mn2+ efflux pump MntP